MYGSITLSGNNASLVINGDTYTLIQKMDDFSLINATPDGFYALAQDIASTDTYTDSIVTSTFTGTFAGLGNAVDGLTIDSETVNTGLFGTTGNGVYIRDLGLTNVNISSSANYTGALIGLANNSGNIYQVYASGTLKSMAGYVGGLIGQANAAIVGNEFNINSSFTEVDVTATGFYIGGLLGVSSTGTRDTGLVNIYGSHATGTVISTTASNRLGGLVGSFNGNIDACYATGNVLVEDTSSETVLGGLIGYIGTRASITIQNSFATSNIGTKENPAMPTAGGLVGSISTTSNGNVIVTNCYATGNVYTGTATNLVSVGGLVGSVGSNITFRYVHATGDVTASRADNGVGGLIGYIQANSDYMSTIETPTIQYAYASGNVTVNNSVYGKVGGLVGCAQYTHIVNSYATGNIVSDASAVGGLVGSLADGGTIFGCYATGNVTGMVNVGGLIGGAGGGYYGDSVISDSYASGDVTVTGSTNHGFGDYGAGGGLIGSGTNITIIDSSATGSIYNPGGGTNAGSLVGFNSSESWLGQSSISYQGTNTYTDVKAEAARNAAEAAYTAYRQETTTNVNAISNTSTLEVSNITEKVSDMAAVANNSKEQQYIAGLPDESGSGSGWGWGSGENGQAVTMAMLGMNVFSAHVKMIMTDEGDIYDFTETEE